MDFFANQDIFFYSKILIVNLIFALIIFWDAKNKKVNPSVVVGWTILTIVFGFFVMPFYYYHQAQSAKKSKNFITRDVENQIQKIPVFRQVMYYFLFAPVPFFMCFDDCLGSQIIMPIAVAWVMVLTIFSLLSAKWYVWYILFVILYASIYGPIEQWIQKKKNINSTEKRTLKIFVYFIYIILVCFIWYLVPLETRQFWLGQI